MILKEGPYGPSFSLQETLMPDQVHITKHTSGKLKGIDSINTSPVSNAFCHNLSQNPNSICSKCYAKRLVGFRRSLAAKLETNTRLLTEAPLENAPTNLVRYVRLHSFGELVNDQHMENFIEIALANPQTMFSLLTKRPEIVARFIDVMPFNIVLTYSSPWLDAPSSATIPEGFDHSYSVFSVGEPCGRECLSCLKCYTKGVHMKIRQLLH